MEFWIFMLIMDLLLPFTMIIKFLGENPGACPWVKSESKLHSGNQVSYMGNQYFEGIYDKGLCSSPKAHLLHGSYFVQQNTPASFVTENPASVFFLTKLRNSAKWSSRY